jgi:hypothetical protein
MSYVFNPFTGTFDEAASLSISDGDKGDITVSSSGSVWTIDNGVITYEKLQNISSGRILGRTADGAGNVGEIVIGTGLTLAGGTLSISPESNSAGSNLYLAANFV